MKHAIDIRRGSGDTVEPNPADAHDASHLRRIIAAKEVRSKQPTRACSRCPGAAKT